MPLNSDAYNLNLAQQLAASQFAKSLLGDPAQKNAWLAALKLASNKLQSDGRGATAFFDAIDDYLGGLTAPPKTRAYHVVVQASDASADYEKWRTIQKIVSKNSFTKDFLNLVIRSPELMRKFEDKLRDAEISLLEMRYETNAELSPYPPGINNTENLMRMLDQDAIQNMSDWFSDEALGVKGFTCNLSQIYNHVASFLDEDNKTWIGDHPIALSQPSFYSGDTVVAQPKSNEAISLKLAINQIAGDKIQASMDDEPLKKFDLKDGRLTWEQGDQLNPSSGTVRFFVGVDDDDPKHPVVGAFGHLELQKGTEETSGLYGMRLDWPDEADRAVVNLETTLPGDEDRASGGSSVVDRKEIYQIVGIVLGLAGITFTAWWRLKGQEWWDKRRERLEREREAEENAQEPVEMDPPDGDAPAAPRSSGDEPDHPEGDDPVRAGPEGPPEGADPEDPDAPDEPVEEG